MQRDRFLSGQDRPLVLEQGLFRFCIKDSITLPVKARVAAEDQAPSMTALQFHQDVGVFTFESVEDIRVNHYDDVTNLIPVS